MCQGDTVEQLKNSQLNGQVWPKWPTNGQNGRTEWPKRRFYHMAKAATKPLLTLTEVAKRTKISMPTLQRYKKLYQARIPRRAKGVNSAIRKPPWLCFYS